MKAQPKSLAILQHSGVRHHLRSSSSVTALYHSLNLHHKILPSVAPCYPGVHPLGTVSKMEGIMELDGEVEK